MCLTSDTLYTGRNNLKLVSWTTVSAALGSGIGYFCLPNSHFFNLSASDSLGYKHFNGHDFLYNRYTNHPSWTTTSSVVVLLARERLCAGSNASPKRQCKKLITKICSDKSWRGSRGVTTSLYSSCCSTDQYWAVQLLQLLLLDNLLYWMSVIETTFKETHFHVILLGFISL